MSHEERQRSSNDEMHEERQRSSNYEMYAFMYSCKPCPRIGPVLIAPGINKSLLFFFSDFCVLLVEK